MLSRYGRRSRRIRAGAGADAGTVVTWAMQGRQPYMAKLMSLLMNCDKMVGGQFEEGLGKLKSLVETSAVKAAAE